MAEKQPSPDDLKAYERAIKGLGPEMQEQIKKAQKLGVTFETLVGFAQSFASQLEHAADFLAEEVEELKKSTALYDKINETFKDTLEHEEGLTKNLKNNVKIQIKSIPRWTGSLSPSSGDGWISNVNTTNGFIDTITISAAPFVPPIGIIKAEPL